MTHAIRGRGPARYGEIDGGVGAGAFQFRRRPGFERLEVELQPDDREARIQRRAYVDGTVEDAHRKTP